MKKALSRDSAFLVASGSWGSWFVVRGSWFVGATTWGARFR